MSSSTRTGSRGFASMNSEKQREIARKGGRAAHQKGTAHEFTSDEARAAGRKGGERVSTNREHMSRIGRIGGKSSAGRRQPGVETASESTDDPGFSGETSRHRGEARRDHGESSTHPVARVDGREADEAAHKDVAGEDVPSPS